MKLQEIKTGVITLELDPDEAQILAATCLVAAARLQGFTPDIDPFAGMGDRGLLSAVIEAYESMFRATGMAAFLHSNYVIKPKTIERESLTGLQKYGMGYRLPFHPFDGESEVDNVS